MDKGPILLVEDSEDDILLIRRAFAVADTDHPLVAVKRAKEAIAYLKGLAPYGNHLEHPFPSLVLLDLKLPDGSGFDLLKWIRERPECADLPVVVLTASTEIHDANLAYRLGADSFLVKPLDFQNVVGLSHIMNGRWSVARQKTRSHRPAKVPRVSPVV